MLGGNKISFLHPSSTRALLGFSILFNNILVLFPRVAMPGDHKLRTQRNICLFCRSLETICLNPGVSRAVLSCKAPGASFVPSAGLGWLLEAHGAVGASLCFLPLSSLPLDSWLPVCPRFPLLVKTPVGLCDFILAQLCLQ